MGGCTCSGGCANTLDNSMSVDIGDGVPVNCVGLLPWWSYC